MCHLCGTYLLPRNARSTVYGTLAYQAKASSTRFGAKMAPIGRISLKQGTNRAISWLFGTSHSTSYAHFAAAIGPFGPLMAV
jgi:hypothetical protein